ncbi:MAG TPA: hypothetical protein VF808_08260 [Ktedonobacterales bacterium]
MRARENASPRVMASRTPGALSRLLTRLRLAPLLRWFWSLGRFDRRMLAFNALVTLLLAALVIRIALPFLPGHPFNLLLGLMQRLLDQFLLWITHLEPNP